MGIADGAALLARRSRREQFDHFLPLGRGQHKKAAPREAAKSRCYRILGARAEASQCHWTARPAHQAFFQFAAEEVTSGKMPSTFSTMSLHMDSYWNSAYFSQHRGLIQCVYGSIAARLAPVQHRFDTLPCSCGRLGLCQADRLQNLVDQVRGDQLHRKFPQAQG